jgi:radical SAM protein with 4Fe4S-binding SPASM domain
VRLAPDGTIQPCTYWPASRLTVADLQRLGVRLLDTPEFQAARAIPMACRGCPCQGGCAGRRALTVGLHQADPFCPFARGQRRALTWERAGSQDLPKAGSACTTIVTAL